MSHLFTLAIEYKLIERCPINTKGKRFKEKGRLRYLLPEEVKTLLDCCAPHIRPIVLTALHTGCRRGEILGMRLGIEVDLDHRIISLTRTKNDEPRHIPVNSTLHAALSELATGKASGDVLFTRQGRPIRSFQGAWDVAREQAGLEDFHFHDLRHTFASGLVMAGVDLYTVKELAGHKNVAMTQRYAHLSPNHRAEAASVLDRVFGMGDEEGQSSGSQPRLVTAKNA